MSYEVTINRVMALCEPAKLHPRPNEPMIREELINRFRAQLKVMSTTQVEKFYSSVRDAAEQAGGRIGKAPNNVNLGYTEKRDDGVDIIGVSSDSSELPKTASLTSSEHLVGRFAPRMFTLEIDKLKWLLRVRASVTGCALERSDGLAKLWWTFEGIPQDPDTERRPTESDAVKFLDTTNAMARAGLSPLRDAYCAGLAKVTSGFKGGLELRPERIRINLADNDSKPFAALIDAMDLEGATFDEAKDPTAFGATVADGATEVSSFIRKVSKDRAPVNASVELSGAFSDAAAVVCEYTDIRPNSGEKEVVLAGLARSISMRGGYETQPAAFRRIEHEPKYLRFISAARPLSAKLAMDHAVALDRQLTEHGSLKAIAWPRPMAV